jgi:hypothetical protein
VQKKNQQQALGPVNNFLPLRFSLNKKATENEQLYRQQRELSAILETAGSYTNAMEQLKTSSLSQSEWQVETWKPYMLETAINIAQKWKKGWE